MTDTRATSVEEEEEEEVVGMMDIIITTITTIINHRIIQTLPTTHTPNHLEARPIALLLTHPPAIQAETRDIK